MPQNGIDEGVSDAVSGVVGKRCQSSVRASIVAFDEMWTYLGVRRGERRKDLWIWTAVVDEWDGIRQQMYEIGGNDESAFSRLFG